MDKTTFKKTKQFLVCVDSDGCAMDTMDVKHESFFGPLAAEVFDIQDRETFQKDWERINLRSTTRGINRFKGLVLALQNAADRGENVGNISALEQWAETTPELSNQSLERAIQASASDDLEKALDWSHRVNSGIHNELTGKDKPFPKVKEVLKEIHDLANIAIVSSANSEALYSEWERHGLLEHVDVVFGQEAGSKAASIKNLKLNGFADDEVLMVGDAPGDLKAAQTNDVLYYPILFGSEEKSWTRLSEEAITRFLNKEYAGEYQEQVVGEFEDLLKSYS